MERTEMKGYASEERVYKDHLLEVLSSAVVHERGLTGALEEVTELTIHYHTEDGTFSRVWGRRDILDFAGVTKERFEQDCALVYIREMERLQAAYKYQLEKAKEKLEELGAI